MPGRNLVAQEENRELGRSCTELRSRLEAAQQRLELAVSRSTFVPSATAAQPHQPAAARSGDAAGDSRRQLFTESAPASPAPPPRRPLRAPRGRIISCTVCSSVPDTADSATPFVCLVSPVSHKRGTNWAVCMDGAMSSAAIDQCVSIAGCCTRAFWQL